MNYKSLLLISSLLIGSNLAQAANPFARYAGSPTVPRLDTAQMAFADGEVNAAFKEFLTAPAENPQLLAGKRVAILTTDGVEEIELTAPVQWLQDRGASVDVVSPRNTPIPASFGVQIPAIRDTHILTVRYFENASWIKIDRFIEDVQASDYDAFIIPGGAWNPDNLRANEDALRLLQAANASKKPIAAICHGPLVLVNAELVAGKQLTAYWNVHIDLKNAGAEVRDEAVVVDGNLITSRFPTDLPPFMQALATQLTATTK